MYYCKSATVCVVLMIIGYINGFVLRRNRRGLTQTTLDYNGPPTDIQIENLNVEAREAQASSPPADVTIDPILLESLFGTPPAVSIQVSTSIDPPPDLKFLSLNRLDTNTGKKENKDKRNIDVTSPPPLPESSEDEHLSLRNHNDTDASNANMTASSPPPPESDEDEDDSSPSNHNGTVLFEYEDRFLTPDILITQFVANHDRVNQPQGRTAPIEPKPESPGHFGHNPPTRHLGSSGPEIPVPNFGIFAPGPPFEEPESSEPNTNNLESGPTEPRPDDLTNTVEPKSEPGVDPKNRERDPLGPDNHDNTLEFKSKPDSKSKTTNNASKKFNTLICDSLVIVSVICSFRIKF